MTWKNARTLGRYKALCNERDSVDVKNTIASSLSVMNHSQGV